MNAEVQKATVQKDVARQQEDRSFAWDELKMLVSNISNLISQRQFEDVFSFHGQLINALDALYALDALVVGELLRNTSDPVPKVYDDTFSPVIQDELRRYEAMLKLDNKLDNILQPLCVKYQILTLNEKNIKRLYEELDNRIKSFKNERDQYKNDLILPLEQQMEALEQERDQLEKDKSKFENEKIEYKNSVLSSLDSIEEILNDKKNEIQTNDQSLFANALYCTIKAEDPNLISQGNIEKYLERFSRFQRYWHLFRRSVLSIFWSKERQEKTLLEAVYDCYLLDYLGKVQTLRTEIETLRTEIKLSENNSESWSKLLKQANTLSALESNVEIRDLKNIVINLKEIISSYHKTQVDLSNAVKKHEQVDKKIKDFEYNKLQVFKALKALEDEYVHKIEKCKVETISDLEKNHLPSERNKIESTRKEPVSAKPVQGKRSYNNLWSRFAWYVKQETQPKKQEDVNNNFTSIIS